MRLSASGRRGGIATAGLILTLAWNAAASAQTTPTLVSVHITAEDGQAVAGAEVMLVTESSRPHDIPDAGKWKPAPGGNVSFTTDDLVAPSSAPQPPVARYHILTRARGWAPSIQVSAAPEAGAAAKPLEVDVKLHRGHQVAIQMTPPAGRELPANLEPMLVPASYAPATWSMMNRTETTDIISVAVAERQPGGRFVFNINDDTPPLYLMINHPGFLRAWQAPEPVATTATLAQPMQFELPEPMKLTVAFSNPYAASMASDARPNLNVTVRQMIPGKSAWLVPAAQYANAPGERTWTVTDLPPGQYYFMAEEGTVESVRSDPNAITTGPGQTITLTGQSVVPPIVAVDENGTTLPEFEARLSSESPFGGRSDDWNTVGTQSKNGVVRFNRAALSNSYSNSGPQDSFQVEVRAPGYALSIADVLAGAPSAPTVAVKLTRGETLTLRLKTADGRPVPDDLKPIIMGAKQYPVALNYLSRPEAAPSLAIGTRTGPDTFEFHVPTDTKAFRIALNDDNLVHCFVSDPYAELPKGPLEITLPETGMVQVAVTLTSAPLLGDKAEDKDKIIISLTRVYDNHQITLDNAVTGITTSTVFSNLTPGTYDVNARHSGAYQLGVNGAITVEAGKTKTVKLTVEPSAGVLDKQGRRTANFPTIKLTSADGKGISGGQIIVKKKTSRSTGALKWQAVSADGILKPELGPLFETSDGAYEVLARAPGFVTRSMEVTLPTSATMVMLQMEKGKEVALQLNDEAGRAIPADLCVAVFPEHWGVPVWLSAQDSERDKYKPELVFSPLGVTRSADGAVGRYTVNIDARSTEPLFVLVNHPGFLRAFQAGPFAPADWATSGTVEVNLPKPATLTGVLDLNGNEAESSVITIEVHLTRQVPGAETWRLKMVRNEMPATSATLTAADLSPGKYSINVTMAPKELEFEPSAFTTDKSTTLDPGESETLSIKYVPFRKEWLQGPYSANVKVLNQKGEPAAGAVYKVTWYEQGYPKQTIAEGTVPANGIVKLEGLAGVDRPTTPDEMKERGGAPSFAFTVGTQRMGSVDMFDYKGGKYVPLPDGAKSKDIEFRVAPAEGDPAPDFAMHDLVTSKTMHLSDFKGQVVLVDFWATWCGSCLGPMAENQEIMRKHAEDWKGKAVILALSIDDKMDTVLNHLDKKDWHSTHNAWAAPDPSNADKSGWNAPAAELYGINSIPTMLLIDKNGIIQKRGHLNDIEAEIQRAL